MRKIWIFTVLVCFLSLVPPVAFAADATMSIVPDKGIYTDTFKVNLELDGNGKLFNAAQATVSLSPNLEVEDLTIGNCNLSFLSTPDITNPSFRGVILGDTSQKCYVYTLTLLAKAKGEATIKLSNTSVIEYKSASNILTSSQNGAFTLTAVSPKAGMKTESVASESAALQDYSLVIKILSREDKPVQTINVNLTPSLGGKSFSQNTSTDGEAIFQKLTPGVYIASVGKGEDDQKMIINVDGKNHFLTLSMRISDENIKSQKTPLEFPSFSHARSLILLAVALTLLAFGFVIVKKHNAVKHL
ncbi:MAG: hypothetical protein ABI758_06365 [Candidatus Woesebacteria bacterium]